MAQRKPVIVDGEFTVVPAKATIADVVAHDIAAVVTPDGLITRDMFAKTPVPRGFETLLSPISKGGR